MRIFINLSYLLPLFESPLLLLILFGLSIIESLPKCFCFFLFFSKVSCSETFSGQQYYSDLCARARLCMCVCVRVELSDQSTVHILLCCRDFPAYEIAQPFRKT